MAACLRFAPDHLRTLPLLDQAEHFLHNQKASVATLRLVFGTGPESCSASPRNAVRLRRNAQESPEEWEKRVNAAWHRHITSFLEKIQYCVTTAQDEEIPPAKTTRGPGRKGRRLNAPLGLRFEWAARRLSGAAWKEISDDFFAVGQITKAASEVLDLAGWPPKAKAPKTRKADGPL